MPKRKNDIRVSIGWPAIGEKEIQSVLKALREKRLSQGKYVREFERSWARYVGKKFAVGVNSGSSANLIAVQALKERCGWKDGDSVIVPALTFATAVMPVLQNGLVPVFADVDRRGNMTLAAVEKGYSRHKGSRIRGMVLVHSLGVPCLDAPKIVRWARAKGIEILEDCCESHGARVAGRRVGAFGRISTTSFYVAHNMTTGEGGMITTSDPELDLLCCSIREFGRRLGAGNNRYVPLASGGRYDVRYAFDRLGYNLRMTDLEAAIGVVQLAKLEAMNGKRRRIVAWYRKELADLLAKKILALPGELAGSHNTYYTLLLIFEKLPGGMDLTVVAKSLEEAGIETRPFMGGNLLRQKAFSKLGKPSDFPGADFLHYRSLSVGCHPVLSRVQVRHAARAIRALYSAS